MELLHNSLFTLQIETYSIFLDKAHSQDIDLKLPADYHTSHPRARSHKGQTRNSNKAKKSGLLQSFIALTRLIPSICMHLVEIGDLYPCVGSAAIVTHFRLRSLSPLTNRHMKLYQCSSPQSSPLVARYQWISISSRLEKSALLAVPPSLFPLMRMSILQPRTAYKRPERRLKSSKQT